MRTAHIAVTALALVACNKDAISLLAQCERDLGANDIRLANAKTDQAAAEKRAAELEAQLKVAQGRGVAAAPVPAGKAAEVPAPEPDIKANTEGETLTPPTPGRLRIGLSLPARRERWIKDKLTMLSETKKRGIELLVQVTDDDPARQITQCENLISQGVKVLIIAPADATTSGVIVEKALKAGVKVISYDRLVMNSLLDYYYLSFDGIKVGELQGQFLTRKVPTGTYVVLAGSPTDNNAKLFRDGAMTFIEPIVKKGQIKVVLDQFVDKWDVSIAQKFCEQALNETKNKIDAVLAATDGLAEGCLQALTPRGLAGKIPITGQNADLAAAIRILDGTQSMTIFKDTRLLSTRAIDMAVALANGKSVDTSGRTISNGARQIPAVLLPPVLVTKENLDDVLIKTGYLNKQAVYRK